MNRTGQGSKFKSQPDGVFRRKWPLRILIVIVFIGLVFFSLIQVSSSSSLVPKPFLASALSFLGFGKDDGPAKTRRSAYSDEAIGVFKTPPIKRKFTVTVLATGLKSPDGIALHPRHNRIYISEEDTARIVTIGRSGHFDEAVGPATPIYRVNEKGTIELDQPLRSPEGIAFATNGNLYAVEDIPDGRLIRFQLDENGRAVRGDVVAVPGNWQGFAWEGLSIGPNDEILMAGSNAESAGKQETLGLFSGAIVYRDAQGEWWAPYQRMFGSFSQAAFSKTGKQALYTCELSGEVGWLDLQTRQPIGGNSALIAKSPEGICPVPDGSVAIAQENGTILLLDPATDQREVIARDLGTIETVVWDARNNRLLATDDHDGRLLAFTPSKPFDTRSDLLEFAPYHPIYSPQYIPRHCPKYLADVLALGGAPFNSERFTNLSFRAFTRRVPLIAADARAIPIGDADRQEDPIERVQFVVFEPNQISLNKKGLSMPLAAFVVRTRSGKLTRTSLMHTTGQRADAVAGQVDSVGDTAIVVPQPAAISVSVLGMATLHFMGLGQTPDFAIAIDPRNPSESYMVVFTPDDRRWHYRLELPGPGEQSDQWIIAYRGLRPDEWTRLSRPPSAPAAPEEHAFTVQ